MCVSFVSFSCYFLSALQHPQCLFSSLSSRSLHLFFIPLLLSSFLHRWRNCFRRYQEFIRMVGLASSPSSSSSSAPRTSRASAVVAGNGEWKLEFPPLHGNTDADGTEIVLPRRVRPMNQNVRKTRMFS